MDKRELKIKKVKIKEILRQQGRTQKWLAEQTGYTNVYINMLANKKSLPSLPVAYRVSEALGVKISEIWVWENKTPLIESIRKFFK